MIDPDVLQWVLAILIVFFGSAVQGVIGYGVGLLGAPLLFLVNPALVPAPLIIVGGILPLLVLRANASAVVTRDLWVLLPSGALGVLIAYLVAGLLSDDMWHRMFGAIIIIAVLASALRFNIRATRPAMFIGSVVSGWMGTISGVGGPPLGVVFQHENPTRVRGTLSAFFAPMGLFSLIALYFLGRLGWHDVWLSMAMLPAAFAGFACARCWGARMRHDVFRWFVLGTASVAGAYSLISSVT